MASPGGKLSSEARLMRNAGCNLGRCLLLQAFACLSVHAFPHPSALRAATFPPGEGIAALSRNGTVNTNSHQTEHFFLLLQYAIDLLDILLREFGVVEPLQAAVGQVDFIHTAAAQG